ncbi:MAG: DUF695 domain-containing protein [Acidobacteria bacterium]|nr:DUF695 domain-containing protein [Acidobacteriota bacterium]
MSDSWDFYFANVGGVVSSLLVDLGIRNSVPDAQRPWLLWSCVYFPEASVDGYPISDEDETSILCRIEEALTQTVKESTEAELVGRITSDSRREFYFYGPQSDGFEEAIAKALVNFPAYQYKVGSREDPDWSHYLNVLYPTPEERELIENRHVVEKLEGYGDSLQAPRPVSHWVYFRSSEDRSKFVAAAVNSGFSLIEQAEAVDEETKYPYGVEIQRVDHVDWDSINDVTLHLFRLAKYVGGKYDGWETSVVKDNQLDLSFESASNRNGYLE